jgi:raffinose/stachyose/melibiose transport system permease protein
MKKLGTVLIGIFITLIIIISVVPFVWVFVSSFKSNFDIISGNAGFTQGFHPENYITAFKMAPFLIFFRNSLLVSIIGTMLNLVTMSMAAYVIARFTLKFGNVVKILFTSVLFIPGAALLYPLFTTMRLLNLYNSKTSLVLVYAGLGMATTFYIMLSYYRTIPKSLEEAAYIDGASFFRTYMQIILPLTKPCFATAGVLQFLLCWNEFQFALTLTTGNEVRTLPIALYYFTSQFASDYGAMFAATTIIAIPSIIFYVVLQKQVINGLTAGSVKE